MSTGAGSDALEVLQEVRRGPQEREPVAVRLAHRGEASVEAGRHASQLLARAAQPIH